MTNQEIKQILLTAAQSYGVELNDIHCSDHENNQVRVDYKIVGNKGHYKATIIGRRDTESFSDMLTEAIHEQYDDE